MADLTSKLALVTGASRGIGQAAARSLAQDGARVLVHYGRGREEAESLVSEIRGAGGHAEAIAADLAAADGAHVLAEKVRKTVDGKLDILVANAGISKSVPIEGLTVEDFDRLFAVNVRAPYFLVQQLLPVLGDGSNVIFVSSATARFAVGTVAAYAATKGAINTLVKHFAAALGPRGIRVNAVAPGVVDTEMSNFAHTESGRQLTLSMQALKRIATPDDIGGVFAFLASDAAQRLLDLDFSGKQTRELLGERDLSMTEVTAMIARGIGKPDLRYVQFPYDQVQQVLTQMGVAPKTAAVYIEMYKAINAGVIAPQEPRSPENSTPTSFENFVQDVFAAAYHGKAEQEHG